MLRKKIRIIMISIKILLIEVSTKSIEQKICSEKRSDSRIMPSVLSTLATFSVSSSSFSSGRSGKARRNVTLNCYNIKSQKSWKEDFSNLPQGPFCRLGILRWGRCNNPRQSDESMFIISHLILKKKHYLLWSSLLTPLEAKLVFLAM